MGDALRGRRVVVTGAARGLGASAVLGLAAEGAECVLLDRSGDELRETVAAAKERGPGPFHPRVSDLADRKGALEAAAFAKEAAAGDLGCLIHCAGVLRRKPLAEVTERVWDETLAVNLTAAFLLLGALLPELRVGGGGSVLLTSSRAGVEGFAGESAYCASKFAVEGFAKAAADDLRSEAVCVNTITPGTRRIKPTGLTSAEERTIPPGSRRWGSSLGLGRAFAAFALLPAGGGAEPTGRRFEADRVADAVRADRLPLPPETWSALGG